MNSALCINSKEVKYKKKNHILLNDEFTWHIENLGAAEDPHVPSGKNLPLLPVDVRSWLLN